MTTGSKHLIQIHVAVILFGFAGLFGKLVTLPAAAIAFWRVGLASLTLGLIIISLGRPLRIRKAADFLAVFLCGVLLAVHWTAFFKSIQVSTVAVGLLSYATFPVFVVFLEPLFFKSRLERKILILSVACLAGIYLIVPSFGFSNAVFTGVVWGLLSSLTFAFLTLINRALSRRLPSLEITFFQDLAAAFALAPIIINAPLEMSFKNAALLFVLGVICTALAHTIFIQALKGVTAASAGIICSLEPVYGVFLAWAILDETPGLRVLAGGLLILFSAASVSSKVWRTASA